MFVQNLRVQVSCLPLNLAGPRLCPLKVICNRWQGSTAQLKEKVVEVLLREVASANTSTKLKSMLKCVEVALRNDPENIVLQSFEKESKELLTEKLQKEESESLSMALTTWESGGRLFNNECEAASTVTPQVGDALTGILPKMVGTADSAMPSPRMRAWMQSSCSSRRMSMRRV